MKNKLTQARSPQALYWLAALWVFGWLGWFVAFRPHFEGDTLFLVERLVPVILVCINEGQFPGCADAGSFPLFQQIPSLLLYYLGVSSERILQVLVFLSFGSFIGTILLLFLTLKERAIRHLALTAMVVMLTGPLFWYSHSTFGEMLAAFLILAFTAASLLRTPGLVTTALFVLAGSTKETALPFLLLIALTTLPQNLNHGKLKRYIFWLVLGVVLTLTLNLGFNYFRYETLYNKDLIREAFIVPSLKLQFSFFLGIWFSPNGGLLFFWPSFVFLYVAIAIAVLLQRRPLHEMGLSGRERLVFYLPLVTVTAILFLLTLGFSRWYAPLGWQAWGPRLMLPWVPAMVLLLLYFYSAQATAMLAAILDKGRSFFPLFVTLAIVSLPQLLICFEPRLMGDIFTSHSGCSRLAVIQQNAGYYYRCLQNMLWPEHSVLFGTLPVLFKSAALWFVIPYYLVLFGLLQSVRQNPALLRLSGEKSGISGSRPLSQLARTALMVSFVILAAYLLTKSAHSLSAYAFPGSTNPEDYEFTSLNNPIDTTPFFIRQHYLDFLNREPDPDGFSHWQNTLDHCPPGETRCDRIEVSSAFFRSPEFQQQGYFILRIYITALGRFPTYSEFDSDLKLLTSSNSMVQHEGRVTFASDFAQRAEFTEMHVNLEDGEYVARLLGNAGTEEVSAEPLMVALRNKEKSRERILVEVAENEAVQRKHFNEAFVRMQYFGYLRRDPDPLYEDWMRVMNESGGNYRIVTSGFVNSREYRRRFGYERLD